MGWINRSVAAAWNLAYRASDADGQERYADDDDFFYTPMGANRKSTAGMIVTPDLAMKASALFSCVRVLSETMGSLPFRMQKLIPGGGFEPAENHPLDELIRYQPNKIQTASEFWETIILHAALRGTGYAEIVPGERGSVSQLISLHTDRVVQELLPDGTLRFRVTNPFTNTTRTLLQEEVLRIPGLSSDGINGLRIVDIASESIGLSLAADRYASRVFSHNLNIGGFLSSAKKMSPEAQRRLISKLMERYASPENFHRPMLLQDGITFQKTAMNAGEAQLLEARKWQISEIARFFRIPLHMLGIDDQTNRSTVEEQSINFVKYTIRPWARKIEQAVRRDLVIATRNYEAKFDLDALERGNLSSRKDYYSAALGASGRAAWMTPNEVRIREGLNRINETWADQLGGLPPALIEATLSPSGKPADAGNNALSPPAVVPAVEDLRPDARADRLARKENKAFSRALRRYAGEPDGMRDWIKAFYGGHVSCVIEMLEIPKDAARAYCQFQRDEALKSNDLSALLQRREDTLAKEIAKTLKQAEN